MDTPEMFPGEATLREIAVRAGWSPSTGNAWAAIFVSPYNENVTLRAYACFFEEGVAPAYLLVETVSLHTLSVGTPVPLLALIHPSA
jgi:hypothetical protein